GIHLASYFRARQIAVHLIRRRSFETVDTYLDYANRNQIRNLLYLEGHGEQILAYNAETRTCDTLAYTDYIS
ncbi:MAG: hypothetical protein MR868_10710, partial [Lachnospiraceae bacterium]|nr:hypothetical protein [Lachnospiraceae bacterium]